MSFSDSFVPAKRRVCRRRRPQSTRPVAPLVVSSVVNISILPAGLEVNLLVDTTDADPVSVTGADPSKWAAYYDSTQYVGESVEAISWNELYVVFTRVGDDASPQRLIYAANPSDVSTASGRKLGAFERELV